MAGRASSKQSREQSIRVKVVPSIGSVRPPVPTTPTVRPQAVNAKPKKPVQQKPAVMPEAQRRRVMWWTVGVGAVIIVGGWLATVKYEVQSTGGKSSFIGDVIHTLRSFSLGGTKPTPKQQEIKQYEQQVFPQFTNQ